MTNKPFKTGFTIGRFQHLHNGHKVLIDNALRLCDNVLVFVGSAQESRTERNPFTLKERTELIEAVYKDEKNHLTIRPLKDLGDNGNWGQYVLDNATKELGVFPDFTIYGNEESTRKWYSKEHRQFLTEMIMSDNIVNIRATKIRSFLRTGRITEWLKYVPREIYGYYELLNNILGEVNENNNG